MKNLLLAVVVALIVALAPLPHTTYVLINTFVAAVFGYCCYCAFQTSDTDTAYICLVVTLIFQPLLRLSLGRTGWIIVDVLVAAASLFVIFGNKLLKPDSKLHRRVSKFRSTLNIN